MNTLKFLSFALLSAVLFSGCVEDEYESEPIYTGRRAYHGSVYVGNDVIYARRPNYYSYDRPRYYTERDHRYYGPRRDDYRDYERHVRDRDHDGDHDRDADRNHHDQHHNDHAKSNSHERSRESAEENHPQFERGYGKEGWKKKREEAKKKKK